MQLKREARSRYFILSQSVHLPKGRKQKHSVSKLFGPKDFIGFRLVMTKASMNMSRVSILLMEEIHHLIDSLTHYLQSFIHPSWCRISSFSSIPTPSTSSKGDCGALEPEKCFPLGKENHLKQTSVFWVPC